MPISPNVTTSTTVPSTTAPSTPSTTVENVASTTPSTTTAAATPTFRSPTSPIALVVSNYNREFTDALLASAQKRLGESAGTVVRVPGAFEIPLQVQRLAQTGAFRAIIALGVVWQGETEHAGEILRAVTDALMRITLETDVPVVHEVLGVKTEAEARARCFGPEHDRGKQAAEVALAWLALEAAPKTSQV